MYIELIVIEDFFINYLVMLAVGILLNRKIIIKKIILSSAIGTIPIIFLFSNLNQLFIIIINFLFSIIMAITSFNYKNIIYTIKNIIYMYLASIFFAGSLYLINTSVLPKINSQILYLIITLSISPIITYIYIKSSLKVKINNSNYYKIDIYLKDKPKITINTFLDTGNKLIDPYTGNAIILIDKKIIDIKNEKIILVPYYTIDNHSLIKCFHPEKIYIYDVGYRKNVLIGLIDEVRIEDANGILNQKLLERI